MEVPCPSGLELSEQFLERFPARPCAAFHTRRDKLCSAFHFVVLIAPLQHVDL